MRLVYGSALILTSLLSFSAFSASPTLTKISCVFPSENPEDKNSLDFALDGRTVLSSTMVDSDGNFAIAFEKEGETLSEQQQVNGQYQTLKLPILEQAQMLEAMNNDQNPYDLEEMEASDVQIPLGLTSASVFSPKDTEAMPGQLFVFFDEKQQPLEAFFGSGIMIGGHLAGISMSCSVAKETVQLSHDIL